jgi:hypothetical protein
LVYFSEKLKYNWLSGTIENRWNKEGVEDMSGRVEGEPSPEVEPLGGLPVTSRGAKSSPGVGFPRPVSALPPDEAEAVEEAVLPIFPPPPERAPPLLLATNLSPQIAEQPDESVQEAVKEYASSARGRVGGEPTAADSYAIMRTKQGQNAVVAAAGQPLLHPPSVAMSVTVNNKKYNVEVSQEGTFLSGPGLLDSSGKIDTDTLAEVLEEVKRTASDNHSLGQWASDQISALTTDNPSAILPEAVALAERAAQSETMQFAGALGDKLHSENLERLVAGLQTAYRSNQVYRDIFSSSSAVQRYDPGAYSQEVRDGLTQNFSSFVRVTLSAVQGRSEREIELEERVSASAPPSCRRVRAAADPALEALTSEDFHDSVDLRPRAGEVGEKDRALGFSRTREACAFTEPWAVGGKVLASETIRIIETRQRAEAGIKKALQELEGRTDDVSNHRRRALEKMLKTLDRDQSFLHATGLREIVERVTKPGSPITIDDIAFAEPPDLVRDSVIVAETGEKIDVIRVGAFSDHLNSVVSLKLLEKAGRGDIEALGQIDATRRQLEERRKTEKLTDPQRVVLQHMIDQLQRVNLPKTLAERREILKQQALQLVATQVGEAGSQLQGMNRLHVAHTSLLYPGKSSWDKSGIGHVEQRMIEDMEQVFSEINGQEIRLDEGLESPYIDADGHIHVPRPKGVDQPTITLATHYVNASATHKLSEPIAAGQSDLAKKTIKELRDDIILQRQNLELQIAQAEGEMTGSPEQVEAAKKRLSELQGKIPQLFRALSLVNEVEEELKGTTTYNTAAKLVEAQKLAGWYASTGCYSDKDRGGLAGRTILTNMVAHSMQDRANMLDEEAANAGEQTEKARQLTEKAHSLQIQARKLMEENPYAAFSPDSCQMRAIQHVVKRPQRYLKAWLGMKQAGKIISVCVPLLARARWGEVREAARKAGREVMARSRLGVRRLERPPAQEVELM